MRPSAGEVEPARFFVHRHIRPQYACRTCETVSAVPYLSAALRIERDGAIQ
jgi:hypothetical protein